MFLSFHSNAVVPLLCPATYHVLSQAMSEFEVKLLGISGEVRTELRTTFCWKPHELRGLRSDPGPPNTGCCYGSWCSGAISDSEQGGKESQRVPQPLARLGFRVGVEPAVNTHF